MTRSDAAARRPSPCRRAFAVGPHVAQQRAIRARWPSRLEIWRDGHANRGVPLRPRRLEGGRRAGLCVQRRRITRHVSSCGEGCAPEGAPDSKPPRAVHVERGAPVPPARGFARNARSVPLVLRASRAFLIDADGAGPRVAATFHVRLRAPARGTDLAIPEPQRKRVLRSRRRRAAFVGQNVVTRTRVW